MDKCVHSTMGGHRCYGLRANCGGRSAVSARTVTTLRQHHLAMDALVAGVRKKGRQDWHLRRTLGNPPKGPCPSLQRLSSRTHLLAIKSA